MQHIESLKKRHMWSLRQLRRHTSVPRSKTHWDSLLDEMKWMRTDFKEERKWKIASAYMVSRAILEWHHAIDKSTVCIKTRIPPPIDYSSSQSQSQPHHEKKDEMDTSTITKVDNDKSNHILTNNQQDSTPVISPIATSNEAEQAINEEEDKSTATPTTVPELDTNTTVNGISVDNELKDEASLVKEKVISEDIDMDNTLTTPYISDDQSDEENDQQEQQEKEQVLLSANIKILCQSILKNCSPNDTVISLPMEEFQHIDIHSLFPDFLMYEPPAPNTDDPYFNEAEYGRIVPITKLSTKKYRLRRCKQIYKKKTKDGSIVKFKKPIQNENIKTLPRNERYDTTPLLSRKSILLLLLLYRKKSIMIIILFLLFYFSPFCT